MSKSIKALARLSVAACALAGLSACATVTRGTTEAFTVESTPPGAKVKTSNGYTCDATPCTWKMARKSEFSVEVSKPGYKTATAQVTNQIAGAGAAGLAGNVIVGGIIGIGVDAVSGAALELKPNPMHITLEPTTASAEVAGATGSED